MNCTRRAIALFVLLAAPAISGCATPNHAGEGTVVGGLLGAGTGAVVGHAVGSTAAGALIGAGAGALAGNAIGAGQDQVEARNRAIIEQQIGRQLAGATHVDDVLQMTRAGVRPDLIVNHVRAHGMAAPLQTQDVILLQQQGVDPQVIAAMQTTPSPVAAVQPVIVQEPMPPPIIIESYWGRPHYRHHPHHCWW